MATSEFWILRVVLKKSVRLPDRLEALAPGAKVIGVDYSATSVAASRDFNAKEIEAGQVQIELGSVAALPFADGTFDIVTAVDQLSMLTQCAGDPLHGLDARPHNLAAPFIQEFSGPGRGVIVPELLEGFLKKVSADRLPVVTEQNRAGGNAGRIADSVRASAAASGTLQHGGETVQAMRRDSLARTSSRALFILATM